MVEGRVADDVVAELERRGHQVTRWPDWEPLAAAVCMAVVDDEHGVISGGSDPRRPTQAIAW
jgi:gamma-glutamyltranspeptidase/glutathione hydrolase